MCGLVGILRCGPVPPEALARYAETVRRMTDAIGHRGPDDSGEWVSRDGRAALGSRRLAIQDLRPQGHMPMPNEDGTVWVSFNGEIYNFTALRSELAAMGHQFRSNSDTEVIVHGWESWGRDVLRRLDGMFAFALYDERTGELLLARDRCGEKPLYYATGASGELIFASEIKAILTVWGRRRAVSPEGLSQYLTFGFTMPPLSMFSGIGKLAPGQAMLFGPRGGREVWSYWSPAADPELVERYRRMRPDELSAVVLSRLTDSVALRMVADVPVGASLSGGVDSSAVVALMSKLSGRPVETVTVGQRDFGDIDETAYARSVAKSVGARFNRVEVEQDDLIGALPDLAWHLDEPSGDPAAINTYVVSQHLRRQGTTVALVGEGADELFLGYPNYLRFAKLAALGPSLARVPGPILQATEFFGQAMLRAIGAGVHSDLLRRACTGEAVFLGTEVFFQGVEKASVLGPKSAAAVARHPAQRVASAVQAQAPGLIRADPLSVMSFSETRMRMAELLLMRVDKMSMAHSIEVRAPFLATDLVEFALCLPGAARTPDGVPKGLLKAALRGTVADEVLDRPKQGFATPIAHWFRDRLGAHLEAATRRSGVFRDGLLDGAAIRNILEAHRCSGRGAKGNHIRLWNILSLCEWYDRYELEGIDLGGAERVEAQCAA
jgi:asparagine synthase (glutamine-hydrolysing)